ncbi:hypothetical protein [Methylocystis sp. SC2]|uniref:hypothetical protein n=1 Tax=Methylocystis sp. (strain SC2) TaxID=187303 RepID=UPI00027AF0F9|nr:hypothetical protein [Methylocystis sp. SC2]CCJ07112.1 Putative tail fiber protein [Methylocystis sp. SC2]
MGATTDCGLPARRPLNAPAPPLHGELLDPEDGARIIVADYFRSARREFRAPAGATIAEIVAHALPGANESIWPYLAVYYDLDSAALDRKFWRLYRPKPNATLLIAMAPGRGGVLRSVLAIGVAALAIAAQQYWAVSLAPAFGLGAAATTVGSGIITAGVTIGGLALVNALVPLKRESQTLGLPSSPTYATSGFSNAINPNGVFPNPLGRGRVALPYIVRPYFYAANGQNYVAGIVGCQGPVEISNIRIGDTPIERFRDIQYEVRQGLPDDEPFTIVTENLAEERREPMGLRRADTATHGPPWRFTARDCTRVELDVTANGGLFVMVTTTFGSTTSTNPFPVTVPHVIRYRKAGTTPWTEVGWDVGGYSRREITFTRSIDLPTRDVYEFQLERLLGDVDDLNAWNQNQQWQTECVWTAMRCWRPEYPINMPVPVAGIAFRLRATDQLNGALRDLNCEVATIGLDYDAETETWVERAIDSPASLYRHVLQSAANPRPLADAKINLAQLENETHPFCLENDISYFRFIDYPTTTWEVLQDVCAAMFSIPFFDGAKWGVVTDWRKDKVVGMVSSANAWNVSMQKRFIDALDGVVVKFYDEENDFKEANRIVPWPEFAGDVIRTEQIEPAGVVDARLAYWHGRKREYEALLRPETISFDMDVEHITFQIGDRLSASFDMLTSEQASGTVLHVSGSIVQLDIAVEMIEGQSYVLRLRKLAETEDEDTDRVIDRTVTTVPGRTSALFLTGTGEAPAEGDLFQFGPSMHFAEDVIPIGKEPAEGLTCKIHVVPYAGAMFDLIEDEEIPIWTPRVGDIYDPTIVAPPVPVLGVIISYVVEATLVFVPVETGAGGGETTAFEIQHRLVGAGSWTTETIPAGSGGLEISGYALYDSVEIRARAVGVGGSPLYSAYTATALHVVSINTTSDFGSIEDAADVLVDFGSIASDEDQTNDWGVMA